MAQHKMITQRKNESSDTATNTSTSPSVWSLAGRLVPHGWPFSRLRTPLFDWKSMNRIPQALKEAAIDVCEALPTCPPCCNVADVPEWQRETAIVRGYRKPGNSFLQAAASLFTWNNETVNFWTHFLPAIYFAWLLVYLFSEGKVISDSYMWPYVVYLFTCLAYMFMSSLAHGFSCASRSHTFIYYFMDYAMLSVYSWGAGLLYYNYSVPAAMMKTDGLVSVYAHVFLPGAYVAALTATGMACASRLANPKSVSTKVLRLIAFVLPYAWVSMPLAWRMWRCRSADAIEDFCDASVMHGRQFVLVALASFFYGSHVPERLSPGRFDFIGHSHNLLHVFGTAGTYEQLQGSLLDMKVRRQGLQSLGWGSSSLWCIIATPTLFVCLSAIVAYYAQRYFRKYK